MTAPHPTTRPDDCPFCRKFQGLDADWPPEDIVWTFPHSLAVLGPWQYYTGYCVLVCRHHARELRDLGPLREAYLGEMTLLAEAIDECFQPRKLNYELLGNLVPHLHWHLFPRYADDPECLKPVWLALDRAERDAGEKHRLQQGRVVRGEAVARLRSWLTQAGAPKGEAGTAPSRPTA